MTRPNSRTIAVLILALAWSAQAFAQRASAQNPCNQLRQACEAAGFTSGGGRGNGLRKDCVDPLLAGQKQSPAGRQLPTVVQSVVAACAARNAPATSASKVIGVGGVTDRLPGSGNSDGLMMSAPQALFTGTKLGMNAMPDQQTTVLSDPGSRFQLFVTGVRPGHPGGVVAVFSTSDLTKASAYHDDGTILSPPQQKNATGNCDTRDTDHCAVYIGMESVFETGTPHDLVGFYIADQKNFANGSCGKGAFYGQLGVATTHDGKNWTMTGPTLRGAKLPTTCPGGTGPVAFNQPTMIKIGSDYYVYFALPHAGKQGIAVARAPVQADGLPGSWSAFYKGQWTPVQTIEKVPTLQDMDMVVPMQAYTTMPWISYNTYLQTYLLTFVTRDAFYYSKLEKSGQGQPSQADIDAQKWTAPEVFQYVPGGENWQKCQVTWENMSFVTPGAADNHVTGKSGYALLSVVPGWSCGERRGRTFAIASYAFGVNVPPPAPTTEPTGPPRRDPPRCPPNRPHCRG